MKLITRIAGEVRTTEGREVKKESSSLGFCLRRRIRLIKSWNKTVHISEALPCDKRQRTEKNSRRGAQCRQLNDTLPAIENEEEKVGIGSVVPVASQCVCMCFIETLAITNTTTCDKLCLSLIKGQRNQNC